MTSRFCFTVLLLSATAGANAQAPAAGKPVTRATVSQQLDAGFAKADTNHDGFLSPAEIQATASSEVEQLRNQARARAQNQFKQLDTNKDGQLSWQEFSAPIAAAKIGATAAEILQKLDTNHDGKLSPAEFKATRLGQFDRVDLNHDGTVTPDEERRANGQK